jgi:ATP adenylyltransferase
MVAPYEHLDSIVLAKPEQLTEMMQLSQKVILALQKLYRPEGFNLGMNLGVAAGAGIREHFHLHVVPRWTGDANFMTVTSETRVLPEDLQTTYRRMKEAFASA